MADAKQATKAAKEPEQATQVQLPAFYRLFFLLIEPISALVGAYFAHFRKHDYLSWTHAASAPASASDDIPVVTSVVLSQLANLYLLFTLNEALVLRATADQRVWKTLLFGLLIADLGHLYSLLPLGTDIYWRADLWNAMDYGNVPFVYLGASMRIAFLLGIGFHDRRKLVKVRKAA